VIMVMDSRIRPDWVRFGQWIARKQAALNISDRELARRTGLSATHIGKLRAGETGTKDETIVKIAHALHVTPEEAYEVMKPPITNITSEEAELLTILRDVPSRRRSDFLRIAKVTSQALASTNA
jgi:transcriptional regulator with XRE-family HTH domain